MKAILLISTIIFFSLWLSERQLRKDLQEWKDYWYKDSKWWMDAYLKRWKRK